MNCLRFVGIITITCFLILFSSCDTEVKSFNSPTEQIADSANNDHTYANLHQIRTVHLDLEMDVNFENKSIYGIARHTMQNNSGTDTAIFDIKGLEIQKITLGEKGHEKETDFMIGPWDKDSVFGQPLLVKLKESQTVINIYYKTTEKTEALDWLEPELTDGKNMPFLYSQGQAILTRSWIPVQDSPSNRLTYSAKVSVPKDMMAIMSATNPIEKSADGEYNFTMNEPIPCYLIALAVGDLGYRKIGKNCGVYAETSQLAKCAREFVDLPKMIQAAESLYGPYQWGQYDMVVLPHSFPFGGMENPRLTFLNPTIVAGDRSLVSVVAHELAHSWSGNLVTNASWNDFWLNEGFTVYFENRIMEQLYGKEIADMLILLEFRELEEEIKAMDASEHPEDSKLKLDLKGRNPDDGLTDIAYIKGAFFLKTIEDKVGRDKFDVFLKSYFHNFAFKTVTTEKFLPYLESHLLKPNHLVFNVNQWVYEEGLPKNCLKIHSNRFDKIRQLAQRFASGEDIFAKKVTYKKIKGRRKKKKIVTQLKRSDFIAQEWQEFIRQLPEKCDVKQMRKLDKEMNFKGWGNAEIMYEWYLLGIHSGYTEIRPEMERFLCKVGRRKYLQPIYAELVKDSTNKVWAEKVYRKAEKGYHPVSKQTIEKLLEL